MNDSVVLTIAVCCSIAGLILLFFAREPQLESTEVSGVVVAKKGGVVQVQTVLPVRARNATVGDRFNRSVFWDGEMFVAKNVVP